MKSNLFFIYTLFSVLFSVSLSFPSMAQWTTTSNGIQYSSGLVTIGNNATNGYKLDLVGRGRLWSNSGGYTAGLSFMNSNNSSERAFVGMNDDNYVGFYGWGLGNWGLVMNVNTGYVGIGTASPTARLQVAGTIDAQNFTINGQPLSVTAGSPSQWVGGTSSGTLTYTVPNARVGIGTGSPGGYTLAVAGKIGAWDEVKVLSLNSPFPDYVFKSDYKLRPLGELSAYIAANGHLPDVPPASEVEQNGMGLSEMQLISIRKIEELTLYILELKTELEALKAKNAQLESDLQALKK